MKNKKFCFDLDGTLCTSVKNSKYSDAKPLSDRISYVNGLFESGHTIIIYTARGSVSKIDHENFTQKQLLEWGVKYHHLICNAKPFAHVYIDDRGHNADEWFKNKMRKHNSGVIAGAFDILHPGYILALKDCKNWCSNLTVALHDDPSTERHYKYKPIFTADERRDSLLSLGMVDNVLIYRSELELEKLLTEGSYDVRFLGDDYKNKSYTGSGIINNIVYLNRCHSWSYSKVRTMCKEG